MRSPVSRSSWAYVAVALLVVSGPVLAQQGQAGMIVGTVRDASGGVISRAMVVVSSASLIGGGHIVTTDRDGTYRAPALPPGDYEVVATALGFRPEKLLPVALLPGATGTVGDEAESQSRRFLHDVPFPHHAALRARPATLALRTD